MRELSFRVFGRELLSVRLGELESDDLPPEHPTLEAGSGGSFELSESGTYPADDMFGFGLTRPGDPPG